MSNANKSNPHLAALLIISLLQIISSSATAPSSAIKGLEAEEKTRLGSTPPSCHSKCNECHPCFAIQVPTLPTHDRLKPTATGPSASSSLMEFYDLPGPVNRYSNYKPLGWKCRCNNHFYNP